MSASLFYVQPVCPFVTQLVAHASCKGSKKVEYCVSRVMTLGEGRHKEGVSHTYQRHQLW